MSEEYADNPHTWMAICHWELLRTPLTPFIGVFYHSITDHKTSESDLQLLKGFVDSLEPARRYSDSIEKYYQLCSTFFEVAKAYVRAKRQQEQQQFNNHHQFAPDTTAQPLEPTIGAFDGYLSTLGLFAPPATTAEHNAVFANDGALGDNTFASHTTEVQPMTTLPDWYSGNLSLYGLLDQDFWWAEQPGFDDLGGGMMLS